LNMVRFGPMGLLPAGAQSLVDRERGRVQMNKSGTVQRRRDGGFTLLELLLVVGIVAVCSSIAIPIIQGATFKAHRSAFIADGRVLYDAFMAYHMDENRFPPEVGPEKFDLQTLDPLAEEGYYPVAPAFLGKLQKKSLMLYLAPDIGTPDSEFITVMRAAYDPNVIMVIAHTQIIHAAGHFLDGVYLINDGQLEDAGELD